MLSAMGLHVMNYRSELCSISPTQQLLKKKFMDLKESKEEFVGVFGERKWKGEMM